MKRLALLSFLLFMCIVINAGLYSEEHRLYLRDGRVITCTTVEYADEGRLRVVMTDGNEIIIDNGCRKNGANQAHFFEVL